MESARCGLIPSESQVPNLVLCALASEESLLAAARRLDSLGISYRIFREPDIGDQFTALCTGIVSGDSRRHFRKYRLLESGTRQRHYAQGDI